MRTIPKTIWVVVVLFAGCRSTPPTHPETVQALVAENREPDLQQIATKVETVSSEIPESREGYRIGIGDVVRVQIAGRTGPAESGGREEPLGVRVQEDGRIYLPMVGAVEAAGRAPLEVQGDVRERAAKYLKEPFVSLEVVEYRSQRFYVLGAINQPGVYPVNGRTFLLDAVGQAGGIAETADLEGAYLVRGRALLPVSLADLLVQGDMSQNILLVDRDYIYVPRDVAADVYVLGEVLRPGRFPIRREGLSLAAALAAAGGLDPLYADKGELRIFRGGWSKPRAYTLSIEDVYRYGSSIMLQPHDRVVVLERGLATWNRTLRLLLPFIETPLTTEALRSFN